MHESEIKLTNGELLPIKVNFLTLYLIKKNKVDVKSQYLDNLNEKYEKLSDKESNDAKKLKEKIDYEQFMVASKIVYIILRSNGQKLEFEEALQLCPADADEIANLVNSFMEEIKNAKKKQVTKI